MCVVCLLLDKGKLTKPEAQKALWEQVAISTSQEEVTHAQDVYHELEKEIGNDDSLQECND